MLSDSKADAFYRSQRYDVRLVDRIGGVKLRCEADLQRADTLPGGVLADLPGRTADAFGGAQERQREGEARQRRGQAHACEETEQERLEAPFRD